ncbi:MAG TPA: class I SAM-dependent methyltransferase [Anaerolineae bacterium]
MDVRQFWSQHDSTLPTSDASQGVGLSHDLYRGMPPWFNAYFAHFQRRAVLRLLADCGPLTGSRGLDVGCGTGRWSEQLAAFGVQPFGVDIGWKALRLAAHFRSAGRFSAAALPSLGFADGVFDVAISVAVLQHIPRQQQPAAIADLARILKPGGWLVACELIDGADRAEYVFANSIAKWRTLFQDTGLRQVAFTACEHLPYIKIYQRLRAKQGGAAGTGNVSTVAAALDHRRVLAYTARLAILASYPLEYLATWLLPASWARFGAFLLVKDSL